jgi:hypothetical protein
MTNTHLRGRETRPRQVDPLAAIGDPQVPGGRFDDARVRAVDTDVRPTGPAKVWLERLPDTRQDACDLIAALGR